MSVIEQNPLLEDENANPLTAEPQISTPFLRGLFTTMLRIRLFEERAAELVEAEEVNCPCHLYIGQEAIAAGVCAALEKRDYVWGGHRSHGHYLAKGGDLRAMMAELFGKSTGCSEGRGGSMHLLAKDVNVLGTVPLVAATIPLAVGTALAAKLRGDGSVSAVFFGDGATEEGHCHESMSMAALYRLPVIFVCENNFYSSHMGLLERRAEDNIYKSGEAHGLPGIRLDGNNAVEVYQAAATAVDRARRGDGPTLLECRTYRWRGHVGPSFDMDVGVKRKDELKDWLAKDPVAAVRLRLVELGVSETDLDEMRKNVQSEVDESVVFARESPLPAMESLVEHVFCSSGEEQR